MEYKLKTPIKISTKSGDIVESDEIVIKIKGEEGGRSLKKLHSAFMKQVKSLTDTYSREDKKEILSKDEEDKEDKKPITAEDWMVQVRHFTNSEQIYDEVMNIVKKFGWIAGHRLNRLYIDSIYYDDIDGIYEEVLKFFLITKLIAELNQNGEK